MDWACCSLISDWPAVPRPTLDPERWSGWLGIWVGGPLGDADLNLTEGPKVGPKGRRVVAKIGGPGHGKEGAATILGGSLIDWTTGLQETSFH